MLLARDRSSAAAWSLSGAYGLGAFPWHTDGALSTNPPRWLVLRAVTLERPTWTEILAPDADLIAQLRRTVLRGTDRLGRVRYLPALTRRPDGVDRVRWDVRTCPPVTGLKMTHVEQKPASALVEWQVGRLLIIDNARVLHRRPSVAEAGERRIERTYVWSE
jgi:alpha-ketoglutarate-dependent taurine dioxygenase